LAHEGGKVSALLNGRLYHPEDTHFFRGCDDRRDRVLLGGLSKPIGNRTPYQPACSTVTQPNGAPRTSHSQIAILYLNIQSENKFFYKLSVLEISVKNKSENAVEYMSCDA
jgi:hypothetical protein